MPFWDLARGAVAAAPTYTGTPALPETAYPAGHAASTTEQGRW